MRVTVLKINDLADAVQTKPDGWYADVLKAGTVRGAWLEIPTATWVRLCGRYGQFGDAFAVLAGPVAATLGLKKDCGDCAQRGKAMNAGGKLVKHG